jgi:2-haloacid dehalogenase
MTMPTVLAFDVNETLLDLGALDPLFQTVLGDDRYVDFTNAQQAALRMTAARAGRSVTDSEVRSVVDAMSRLPAHPEVPESNRQDLWMKIFRRLPVGGGRRVVRRACR